MWIYTELEYQEESDMLLHLQLHSSYPTVHITSFTKIKKNIKIIMWVSLILSYFTLML